MLASGKWDWRSKLNEDEQETIAEQDAQMKVHRDMISAIYARRTKIVNRAVQRARYEAGVKK